MIAKLFNIALTLLFALLSSLTYLHGLSTTHYKVVIAAIVLFFILTELTLYYILSRFMPDSSARQDDLTEPEESSYRETAATYGGGDLSELLTRLPPECIVLKNFYRNGFNADFVVIGPTGIHIIDIKEVSGDINKSRDLLLLNNRRSIGDFIEVVKRQAADLQRDFKSFGRKSSLIKPVLCFTRARLSRMSTGIHDGVLVTSARGVITDITENENILDSFDVYGIYTFLSRTSAFRKLSIHNAFLSCYSATEPC